jgi:hypothetical protein
MHDRCFTLETVLETLFDDREKWHKYTLEETKELLKDYKVSEGDIFGYYEEGKPAITIIPSMFCCIVYVEGVRYCFWFFEGANLIINLLYPRQVNEAEVAATHFCQENLMKTFSQY